MPTLQDLAPQLSKLLTELDRRAPLCSANKSYLDGGTPIPDVIATARLTRAYKAVMGMAQAPWASLVVDSKLDRVEVGGIRTGDKATDQTFSDLWQGNGLDAESKLAHHGVFVDGRVFATVWPGDDGQPEIVLDGADQVVVLYREGRHQPRHRVAALRRWVDDDDDRHITLYRADALYKLSEVREGDAADTGGNDDVVQAGGRSWRMRVEIGRDGLPEPWPLPNPYNVVPVVELATNRRLQPGPFPFARGEFEHCTGLIDRINLLTFLGLVVAIWMGFPLRYVLGGKILRDDDDKPLPPFDSKPDSVVQFEDHEAKIGQLQPADRKNLSIYAELGQLAYLTKVPAHYFPMDSGLSNISADMIRALEGGLHANVDGIHKPFLGAGWEETLRVAGLMLDKPIDLPRTSQIVWLDRQSRSFAERADAAVKLKDMVPFPVIAEEYLGYSQELIRRCEAAGATSVLTALLQNAAGGGAPPAPPGG